MGRYLILFTLLLMLPICLLQRPAKTDMTLPTNEQEMPGKVVTSGFCFWEHADDFLYCETTRGSVIEDKNTHVVESVTLHVEDVVIGDVIAAYGAPLYVENEDYLVKLYWKHSNLFVSTWSSTLHPYSRVAFVTYSKLQPVRYVSYSGFH